MRSERRAKVVLLCFSLVSFNLFFRGTQGSEATANAPPNITLYNPRAACALDTFCALWFDSSSCVAVVKGAEAKRTRQSEPLTTTPLSNCFLVGQLACSTCPPWRTVEGVQGKISPAGGLGASPNRTSEASSSYGGGGLGGQWGATTTPPLCAECQHFKKKRLEPYSPKGFSDYFCANKSPTKSPTR